MKRAIGILGKAESSSGSVRFDRIPSQLSDDIGSSTASVEDIGLYGLSDDESQVSEHVVGGEQKDIEPRAIDSACPTANDKESGELGKRTSPRIPSKPEGDCGTERQADFETYWETVENEYERDIRDGTVLHEEMDESYSSARTRRLISSAGRRMKVMMAFLAQIIVMITFLLLVIAVPYFSYELYKRGEDPIVIAWFSAGVFTLMALPISVYGIVQHLLHWDQPKLQIYVVRILWMVPLYSVESWLSLRFKDAQLYIEAVRDFYEAYVVYSFLYFLIAVLTIGIGDEKVGTGSGGHSQNELELVRTLARKPAHFGHHFWPVNYCLRPWRMGRSFLINCKQGTLQYVVLKLITTVVSVTLEWHGAYGDGDFSWKKGYVYIALITSTSQTWALYCLVLFFHATRTELAPINPLGKFLCVKAIVFFSFWQSIGIAVLVEMGLIQEHQDWTADNVAKALQDYVICIEMFFAAIMHYFVFSYRDFEQECDREPFMKAFYHSSVPLDVYRDVKTVVETRGLGEIEGEDEARRKTMKRILDDGFSVNLKELERFDPHSL